jgi:hypothetical protein
VAAAVATAVSGAAARGPAARPCYGQLLATVRNSVVRFCGPAQARLNVFPGAVFQNGTCVRERRFETQSLVIELGSRSLDNKRNRGFRYMHLALWSAPRAAMGTVTAYSKGKRWDGFLVTAYKPNTTAGRFVAQAQYSRKRVTGSFRCLP